MTWKQQCGAQEKVPLLGRQDKTSEKCVGNSGKRTFRQVVHPGETSFQ